MNITWSPATTPARAGRPPATDYERIASRYDISRKAPTEWVVAWRDALEPFLGRSDLPVLDVGCGTGYWAVVLADWFSARVVAVEPSRAMLREAAAKRRHPAIDYLGGRGESLPLRDCSCESAWVSTVVHHVSDLEGLARELHRVLAPGAWVLIRNAFSGRTRGIPWLHYFGAHVRRAAEARWPTVEEVLAAFEPAGFILEKLQPVEEKTALCLAEYASRVSVRADSTLAAVSDQDFERGMRSLEQAAAAEKEPEPVVTTLDLLVLRRA
ncbi:MAG: class I SAM-dependent methyltransferase [Actinomycetota bacterium]|nr:class I SAM-dependent methyltransferase [Actinomycetota bacterium]